MRPAFVAGRILEPILLLGSTVEDPPRAALLPIGIRSLFMTTFSLIFIE